MRSIFQKKALEKKRSRGTSNKPVSLLNTPLKTSLFISIILAAGGLAWSILAKIPLQVNGFGFILPNKELTTITAASSGKIIYMFENKKFIDIPYSQSLYTLTKYREARSHEGLVKLANQIIFSYYDIVAEIPGHADNTPPEELARTGTILALIAPEKAIEDVKLKLLNYLRVKQFNESAIQAQQVIINANQEIYNSKSVILRKMYELKARNYLSENQVLQYESDVNNAKTSISSGMVNIASQRDQIESARDQLLMSIYSFASGSVIFSTTNQYVVDVDGTQLESISSGKSVLTVSPRPINTPETIPVFFDNSAAISVAPKMKLLATPTGLNRAADGGIIGQIVSMELLPGTRAYVRSITGLSSVGDIIFSQVQYPTAGVARLKIDPNRQNTYMWSSGSPPNVASLDGDLLDIVVTTGYARPIDLVIPYLKEVLGFVPPSTKKKGNQNGR